MKQFIECICHNNYQVLIEQGEASAQQLADAWSSLFFEYCDLTGVDNVKARILLASEINLIRTKHRLLLAWLQLLEYVWSEDIAEAIRTTGYDVSRETFSANAAYIKSEIRIENIHLKIKEQELEQMNNDSGQPVDESYFDKVFFIINNYAKREAVNKQSTVQEYCVALRCYHDYLKLNN